MNARRLITPTAAVVMAAALTGGTASVAAGSVALIGTGSGTGATLAAAQNAANHDLIGSYSGCKAPFVLVDSGQDPGGTWFAEVKANCTGIR
jgi:hypothetical protein